MNLKEFLDNQVEVKQERFVVDDDSKANWALGKIGELKDELESSQKLAEKEIDKVERWLAKEEKRIGNEIDFFEDLLFKYALRLKNKDPKFRTKSLPNGAIKFRKQRDKWVYDDEKLLNYLEKSEMHDLIRINKEPKKNKLREKFDISQGDKLINPETGEIVDGITIEERGDKFSTEVIT